MAFVLSRNDSGKFSYSCVVVTEKPIAGDFLRLKSIAVYLSKLRNRGLSFSL